MLKPMLVELIKDLSADIINRSDIKKLNTTDKKELVSQLIKRLSLDLGININVKFNFSKENILVTYKDEEGEDTVIFDNEKDADEWIKIQEGRRSSGEKFELISKTKINEEKDFMELYDKNFSKVKNLNYRLDNITNFSNTWYINFYKDRFPEVSNKLDRDYAYKVFILNGEKSDAEKLRNLLIRYDSLYPQYNKPSALSIGKEIQELKNKMNMRSEYYDFSSNKNFSLSDMEKDLIKFIGFKELPNYDKISGASLIFDGNDFIIYFGFDEEFGDPSIDVYDKKGNCLGSINGVKTYQIKDLVKKNKNDIIKYLDEIEKFNSKHITNKVNKNFGSDDNYGDTQNIDGIDREAVFQKGMSLAHEIYGDDADEAKVWKDVEIAIKQAIENGGGTQEAEKILEGMYTSQNNFSEDSPVKKLYNI